MTTVVLVGEPMVELDEAASRQIARRFGGDTFNTAVHLAVEAPTLSVQYVSAVGDDPFSTELITFGTAHGIDMSPVSVERGGVIGLYLIVTDPAGERSFTYWRGDSPARRMFSAPDPVRLPPAGEIDVLMFSGITLAILDDHGREFLTAAASGVRQAGGIVAYDPNHRPRLWSAPVAGEWLRRVASTGAMVLASAEDGLVLGAGSRSVSGAAAFAAYLRDAGAREVAVTAAAGSCVLSWGDRSAEVAAEPVDVVVDSTGAGDAFNAGYLGARLAGSDAVEAARRGHRRAALVVGHRGAIAGMTARTDI